MNDRQRRFVAEYLVDLNATDAARRAGYSEKTARQIGAENLSKPDIAAAIAEATQARLERIEVKADDVLRELIAMYRTNPSHFKIGEDGALALTDPNNTDAWRAVASVKQKIRALPNGVVERECEYRLWNKPTATDMAMRHLGLLKEGAGANVTVNFVVETPPKEDVKTWTRRHQALAQSSN